MLNKPERAHRVSFPRRDLHLVMARRAPGTSVRFRVLIDGQPPLDAHGSDVDAQGSGAVTEQRLYQLVRQAAPIVDRQFGIEFLGSRRRSLRVHVRLSRRATTNFWEIAQGTISEAINRPRRGLLVSRLLRCVGHTSYPLRYRRIADDLKPPSGLPQVGSTSKHHDRHRASPLFEAIGRNAQRPYQFDWRTCAQKRRSISRRGRVS